MDYTVMLELLLLVQPLPQTHPRTKPKETCKHTKEIYKYKKVTYTYAKEYYKSNSTSLPLNYNYHSNF